MISLDIQDYCQDCPNFEPEKVVIEALPVRYTFVQCENKGKCMCIAEHIKRELAGKEDHGQSRKET